jgi:large subunit ribosomal protein L20
MPRARKGAATRQSKVRWFKAAKGYRGGRGKQWRRVKGAVIRAGAYATRDRRRVKREYRSLWVLRINAAVRERGLSYSRFIAGLRAANILLNRKMLSELAIADAKAFDAVFAKAKAALAVVTPAAVQQAQG